MRFTAEGKKFRLLIVDCPPNKAALVRQHLEQLSYIGPILQDRFRLKFSVCVSDLTEEAAECRLKSIRASIATLLR